MKAVLIIIIILTSVGLLIGISQHLKWEQRRRWLRRFSGRSRIAIQKQILDVTGGRNDATIEDGWEVVARILHVDPELLRPTDKIDGVLGEDKQFPCDGDFHDLCDEIRCSVELVGTSERIITLWDAAKVIGKAKLRRLEKHHLKQSAE